MKKFCVLDCEASQVWKPESFADMFVKRLRKADDQSESWVSVNIALGDPIPNPDDYDGFVITGSHCNCRDLPDLKWMYPLIEFVKLCYENGKPKLYGGCFGCQVIALALGGEVDYNPGKRFLCKAEMITPISTNILTPYLNQIKKEDKSNFTIIVSHGDCVLTLPPNSKLLASSLSCTHEIYLVGKDVSHMNIFACQSHPEFDVDYAIWDRIWPIAVIRNNRLSAEEREEYEPCLRIYDRSHGADALITCIQDFLYNDNNT